MSVYYNENDATIADWLNGLIRDGELPDGQVDRRSIADVQPGDLRGFRQCHFFAGIGGWAYALRLAGWPGDRECWTGSCPCQPYSVAGKGQGFDDPRDLWPAWLRLIEQCRPRVIFGEQTSGTAGGFWIDRLLVQMEARDFAVWAGDLPACSVGAFHRRQRLWWVADTDRYRVGQHARKRSGDEGQHDERAAQRDHAPVHRGAARRMADDHEGRRAELGTSRLHERRPGARSDETAAGDVDGSQRHDVDGCGAAGLAVGDTGRSRLQGHAWDAVEWLPCIDGKARPIEPGSFPLAHGVSGRVAIRRTIEQGGAEVQQEHWYNRRAALHGFGNAIVPKLGAEVICAYMDARGIY